jgi:sterol desaturase/sphingolipid hydroxylase (fatty acid hydroxylase superfamily)
MGALAALGSRAGAALVRHVEFLATPHAGDAWWPAAKTLLLPWAVHFFWSWAGFLM